jgi:hypothetical protein
LAVANRKQRTVSNLKKRGLRNHGHHDYLRSITEKQGNKKTGEANWQWETTEKRRNKKTQKLQVAIEFLFAVTALYRLPVFDKIELAAIRTNQRNMVTLFAQKSAFGFFAKSKFHKNFS